MLELWADPIPVDGAVGVGIRAALLAGTTVLYVGVLTVSLLLLARFVGSVGGRLNDRLERTRVAGPEA